MEVIVNPSKLEVVHVSSWKGEWIKIPPTGGDPIGTRLLTYLRNKFDDPSIQYSLPPTPLTGGYMTKTYRFELQGAPERIPQGLVLRLFPPFSPTGQAYLEGTVQTVLYNASFPAPRVVAICTDPAILGGEFLVMAYMVRELLLNASPVDVVPEQLAQTQLWLHSIDPQPVIDALDRAHIRRDVSACIALPESRIATPSFHWLKPGLAWIHNHIPQEPTTNVICHGDFHPYNILVDKGRISAVLDWSAMYLVDSAFDVADTVIKLSCNGPGIVPSIDWPRLTHQYVQHYAREHPLDSDRLTFYEAVWCLRVLALAPPGFVQLPGITERLLDRLTTITGI
ncbi:MAG: phosphotransferase [Candidatus Hermodarchaeia archaeon]